MYIEGNALILGDSSYLEHHGIKGQHWGVRRFQNRDGSLTNAGRKRLGYATKGAIQTVGKAFKAGAKAGSNAVKAGVKAGGNAVKAAKAHHEKKEAEKLQKKKEKASKTRLGVMANKDLFTNEEIRKLNERFKLEDEMKMATIQKGVEIAKAVGTIAQNVGTVAKTYEDITGTSLSPIKRKAAEEKARQEKEDRERRLAREDAEEARKSAKEERDIAIHEQTLRKAIASADTQEFTARKTKADADSTILDLYKKGREFNGGSDSDETGKSWMEKATSGGGNVFERMKYESDPEYRAAKDAHDKKVEWQQHEKERDARVFGRDKQSSSDALNDMINASERNRKGGSNQEPHVEWNPGGKDGAFTKAEQQSKSRPSDPDDIPFTSKNLRLEKDRYAKRDAFRKAKEVKDNAEEKRAKEQDDKAAKSAIDTIMKDYRNQDDVIRNMNPGAYDREVAKNVIKNKAKDTLNKISHPVDAAAKKIADKHREEKWAKERKNLWKEYEDTREKLGPEAAARAYNNAKKQALQNLGYRGEALERKMNETKFYKKKDVKHSAFSIQNGVLFIDSSDGLTHHGVKGQRWGVRRFQNPDGTLTDAGKRREARQMARELNQLDSRQATASRNYSNLSMHKGYYDKKVGKLEYKKSISDEKGNLKKSEKLQKKIDKGKANVERISRMMKFASDDYDVSEKKIKTILSKINESTDYAWKTTAIEREFTSYNGGFYKDMKNNAGKSKLFEGNYYESAYGNHYTVKHDKNGKRKKKWEASKQQRQTHNPVHTVHYYY